MTKRDFFILILRLFGLYSIVTSLFTGLPSAISYALIDMTIGGVFWVAGTVVVMVGLFLLLIFRAEAVVDKLRLDKGFDEDRIEVGGVKSEAIIKLACLLLGGSLIIHNIPAFLNHTLYALKSDIGGFLYDKGNQFDWAVTGVNLIVGYLLITNYHTVAKFFNKKADNNTGAV